jgi:branched-chain amino acid transport system permease protein
MSVGVRPCGEFVRSYPEDERILKTRFVRASMALFILGLLALPFLVGSYVLAIVSGVLIAIVGATGLNILTGYAGLISVGQGGFMGVGAYTVAVLATAGHMPFWITIPAAGLVAALVGVMFGLPSLRLKGFYLAIATLAAQFILDYVFMNWESVTKGAVGILVPRPMVLGVTLTHDAQFYYFLLVPTVLAVLVVRNLFRTHIGRALIAVRDQDLAAEILGVSVVKMKLVAFALSSFYAGVAGGLLAYYATSVAPGTFALSLSIDYLAMIIIGGLGTPLGPILGAAFVLLIPDVLQHLIELLKHVVDISYTFAALREIVFGLFIIGFLIGKPDGLARFWRDFRAYWKLWPFAY